MLSFLDPQRRRQATATPQWWIFEMNQIIHGPLGKDIIEQQSAKYGEGQMWQPEQKSVSSTKYNVTNLLKPEESAVYISSRTFGSGK